MMLLMIMFFSFLINLMFLNFNNPLIMGMLMIMQTMMIIMLMGKMYYSFWFSYIMFLVFIGGLFILFIYIISLIYNNKFYFMKKMNYFMFSMMIIFMMKFKILFIFNYETNNFFTNNMLMKENYMNSLKFYNFPNNYMNMLLIMYLLLLLIIVVKITNFLIGPIRSMN